MKLYQDPSRSSTGMTLGARQCDRGSNPRNQTLQCIEGSGSEVCSPHRMDGSAWEKAQFLG